MVEDGAPGSRHGRIAPAAVAELAGGGDVLFVEMVETPAGASLSLPRMPMPPLRVCNPTPSDQSSANSNRFAPNAFGPQGFAILRGNHDLMIASFAMKNHCRRYGNTLSITRRGGKRIKRILRIFSCDFEMIDAGGFVPTRRDAPAGRLHSRCRDISTQPGFGNVPAYRDLPTHRRDVPAERL